LSLFPEVIQKEMKKYDEEGDVKKSSKQKPIFKICQKPNKERTPLERRKVYNYIKGQVNFFRDLEKEKLEMLAP
jgi:hypothetical protein